ncbi:arginyl-tRNA synthetase [Salinibacterium sp. NSLL150]|uniref:arginyl-tRNA synthetase n=1 Tax=unclassified Salinibacterium TaxID=2632331 RepID=UPI0018CF8165|nr:MULTISPECIES: arginyl-tRNA synthetase [unclassified Salinibacterium]MBH0100207.1 arginyl-tRNA synthetase [Salinibacterium sp. NSLL35]MBH0102961.1 arginyl-tRNA synthetase [Salinibacterium sp. NSLL150]MBH0105721.1 arginyl-tRNA synthetase [Salinibacterium sp. NSLL16]MBH0108481.1 arginyl-tRNA synthetase [Salinibacterium sp. NSLL17]MBH0111259.1 arginyl-tRNA synthetase [Salinibacterium sp. NG22]
MASRLRVIPAVIALSASALLLSACVPTEPDPVGPNPTRTIDPDSTATPEAEPTATTSPDPEATPVDIACTELISPQAMYDFNSNFLLLNSFTPPAGSTAETAFESRGTICRWENSTSGVTIDVSVAQPTPAKYDSLKSNSGASTSSFDGYFAVSGGVGTAQVFAGAYWATLSSPAFFEAADAADLVADVEAALN